MTCTWIDAKAIWEAKNKPYLDHLLHDSLENSPVLTFSRFPFPTNQFFFWPPASDLAYRGWGLWYGSPGTKSWVVLRGNKLVFLAFFQSLKGGEEVTFDYIREEETPHFTAYFGKQPALSDFYYEMTPDICPRGDTPPLEWLHSLGLAVHDFPPPSIDALLSLYKYQRDDIARPTLQAVKGLYVTRDDRIIAAMYDNLSIVPRALDAACISGVLVADTERNKGICNALTRLFLERLFQLGNKKVGLFVSANNHAAIKCYENAGLVQKKKYYRLELDPRKSSS
nr:GNAT family N-acetyltransferase [Candidatus Sigynarchaeota archaeon]